MNPHLKVKTFPLPTPDEVFATLPHGESFSKLDLARAYKQMEVEESGRPPLTINTPLGLFQYCRMPFGIASAPAIWQKAMSVVLKGCKRTVCFIDDILVTGETREEHEENLRQVFQRLQQYGLRVKLDKCSFFQEELEFLGHTISKEGVQPTKERVASILAAATPKNKTELKSFLGLMTYNVKFLPAISHMLHPLYGLLRKEARWSWGKKQKRAFKKAKELVSKAPVLAHYDVSRPIKVYCDASSYGLGACLMHVIDGQEKPVAFASRVLTKAETNYAQIEREALAIIFAVKRFHQYLCGREFTLVTERQPLCKILGHKQGVPSLAAARIQRWALILSAYSYGIEYKPGSQNECADCLSRLPVPSKHRNVAEKTGMILKMDVSTLPVSAYDVAEATRKDNTLGVVLQHVRLGSWPRAVDNELTPFYRRRTELSLHDGCLLWGQRVIIPKRLRSQLLEELHEGHVGVCRMKALARSFIWWPGLDQDIVEAAAGCEECKLTAAMPAATSRHPWQHPAAHWDRVHVNFGEWCGKHFIVMVDAFSKWPEVRYLPSTTANCTIEVLEDVFATHGFPRLLASDNGPQLTADEFDRYLKQNRVSHHKSPPYHPSTNGLAENMVKNVKQWLKKQSKGTGIRRALASFLRTYRNVPHTSTGRTPEEIVFGRVPRTHLSMVVPSLSERVKESLQQPPSATPRRFSEGDMVWVRDFRPNGGSKWQRGTVLRRTGALNYEIELEGGHQRKVHVDHMLRRVPSALAELPESTASIPVVPVPLEEQHTESRPGTPTGCPSEEETLPSPDLNATPEHAANSPTSTAANPGEPPAPQSVSRSSRQSNAPDRLIEHL